MTRNEVIVRAIAKEITWIEAARICGITDRHMRRLKERYEEFGYDGLVDHRGGRPRRKRVSLETIEKICELKRTRYADFSVQHFWEKLTEQHEVKISYTWTKLTLQAAGLVEKYPARGKYRRKRERRPMIGMMVHLDASRHQWLEGQPMWDLMVALDDADGRILYARFVAEENTLESLAAIKHIVRTHGRFAELYTDRGSHFCHTPKAGEAPSTLHNGQVSRALKVLGIRQILARSPEARGRSERAFGTIQGRLPQELREAGITDYERANEYLEQQFVPDFNRRFTVASAQTGSAFVPMVGVDLDQLLSVQHTRVVGNDSCVRIGGVVLQLPRSTERPHYVRCEVTVHEFTDGTLGVSYQGRLLAQYDCDGELIAVPRPGPKRAPQRPVARPALLTSAPKSSSTSNAPRPAVARLAGPHPTTPRSKRALASKARVPSRGGARVPAPLSLRSSSAGTRAGKKKRK
jgi:transposase